MCLWKPEDSTRPLLLFSTCFFETGPLTKPEVHLPLVCLLVLETQTLHHTRVLKSGPPGYTTSSVTNWASSSLLNVLGFKLMTSHIHARQVLKAFHSLNVCWGQREWDRLLYSSGYTRSCYADQASFKWFIFLYVSVSVSKCHVYESAHEGLKKLLDLLSWS